MKKKILNTSIFVVFILVLVLLSVYFFPFVISLTKEENRVILQNKIDSWGFWGYFAAVGIQVLQVVVAVLPGEPIEIILGFMYGPFWGTIICLIGIVIGSLIIYVLAKVVGKPFLSLFMDIDKIDQYRFLNTKTKKDSLVFFLFLIPGTPKDALTYFVPFIKMNPFRFILISLLARIPSILTSTLSGSSISKGRFTEAILIFIATFVVAVIGYLSYQKVISHHQKEVASNDNSETN